MNNPNSSDGRFTPAKYYSPRSRLEGSPHPLRDIRMELNEVSRAMQRTGAEALETALSKGADNLLINGRFDYWQRGASFTGITNASTYTADRWLVAANPGSANIDAVRTVVAAESVPTETPYALQVTINSVSGVDGYVYLEQRVEDVRLTANRLLTLSFWARDTSGNNKSVAFSAYQQFGTTNARVPEVHKVQMSSTWQQYHVTFFAPSLAGHTIDGTNFLYVRLWLAAGSNRADITDTLGLQTGVFEFTNFKLEFGNIVTPLNPRMRGQEFALCQRYFQYGPSEMVGYAQAANAVVVQTEFEPLMRATPTITLLDSSIYTESPWFSAVNNPTGGYIAGTHVTASSTGVLIGGYSGLTPGATAMVDGRKLSFAAEL